MQPPSSSAFDFQQWAALAKADPEAFEARRAQEIEDFIAAAAPHHQARLRGLQWQVDLLRSRARNPLSACVQIFNQMWDSVYGERGLLDALRAIDGPPLPEQTPGDVVDLQQSKRAPRHDKITRPSLHP